MELFVVVVFKGENYTCRKDFEGGEDNYNDGRES